MRYYINIKRAAGCSPKGVMPLTVAETLLLLNLLAVIIFGTVDITRKKK